MSIQKHGNNSSRGGGREAARRKLTKRGITPASMKGAKISKPNVGDGKITVDDRAKIGTDPKAAREITMDVIKSTIKRK